MRHYSRDRRSSRSSRHYRQPASKARAARHYNRYQARPSRGNRGKWILSGFIVLVLLTTFLIVTTPWEAFQLRNAQEVSVPLSVESSSITTQNRERVESYLTALDQQIAEAYEIPDNHAHQEFFLELVNQARTSNDMGAVAWDDLSEQVGFVHAIDMAAYQYMSHWNQLGFGPDIRYSLAGGTEWVQENVYSFWYRYETGQAVPIDNWESVIEDAHENLMNSPGHRANILNPEHTHVGIGMAYNTETGEFRAAQEFINRYIDLDNLPQEANPSESITISGQLLLGSSNPLINIAYEPYPQNMTVKALNETNTYQTPAEFVEVIPVSVDSIGYFEAEFELGAQSGLYHIYIWVDYADMKPQAIDRVIWVPAMPEIDLNIPIPAPNSNIQPDTSEKAPDFSLNSIEGQTISLSDYNGKPVLLFFFASWCQYCQAEAEVLMSIYNKFHAQGFDILAINLAYNDDVTQLGAFIERYGWEFPVVLDDTGDVSKLYHQMGVPMNVFVTSNGSVGHIIKGVMEQDMIDQIVQQLLSD